VSFYIVCDTTKKISVPMTTHEAMIAIAAQDAANFTSLVIVVHSEGSTLFFRRLRANRTTSSLTIEKLRVLLLRNPVDPKKIGIPPLIHPF